MVDFIVSSLFLYVFKETYDHVEFEAIGLLACFLGLQLMEQSINGLFSFCNKNASKFTDARNLGSSFSLTESLNGENSENNSSLVNRINSNIQKSNIIKSVNESQSISRIFNKENDCDRDYNCRAKSSGYSLILKNNFKDDNQSYPVATPVSGNPFVSNGDANNQIYNSSVWEYINDFMELIHIDAIVIISSFELFNGASNKSFANWSY